MQEQTAKSRNILTTRSMTAFDKICLSFHVSESLFAVLLLNCLCILYSLIKLFVL